MIKQMSRIQQCARSAVPMKFAKLRDLKPSGENSRDLVYTTISKEARHELKILAALNHCTMLEMLDIILVHWCNFRTRDGTVNIKEIANSKNIILK